MGISYNEAVKMRKRMSPVPGFPRYGIYNGRVWSHRYGKFVAVRNGNVEVWSESGRKHHLPVAKLVYCADNGIDPRECPDDYSFYIDGDGSPCVRTIGEAHSEAMRKVDERRKSDENVEAVKSDYEKASYYVLLMRRIIDTGEGKDELHTNLYGYRDALVKYARTARGGVGYQKALMYADQAISRCYEAMTTFYRAIAFPEAYMKRTVGNLITNGRKSRLVHLFEDRKI